MPTGRELLICSSFSKNFGLYCERVGALTIVAATPEAAQAALSHAKTCVRVNYSNPPRHGAAVVATVLGDAGLRAEWEQELAAMRSRINGMRKLFVDTMKKKVPARDFSFIARQRGMFSFSGLTTMQVDELRNKHAIYVVGAGGRMNVAGMTEANMGPLVRCAGRGVEGLGFEVRVQKGESRCAGISPTCPGLADLNGLLPRPVLRERVGRG